MVVIMFEKLKTTKAPLQSGRNYQRGTGDFRHCFISASRFGRGTVCSLVGEDTCHALTPYSRPNLEQEWDSV